MRHSSMILMLALWSSVAFAAQPATDGYLSAGMPPVVDANKSLQRNRCGQAQSRRCERAAARVRAEPPVERRLRDRSGDDEGGRQVSGRPQSAARRAVVGPEDALGRQQRRGAHRRHADADRSGDRQARQGDRRRRSVQHVLHSRWAIRDRRRRGAQAARLPRSADDGDAGLAASARVRRHQPRRFLDRRPLRDLHLRVHREPGQDRHGQPQGHRLSEAVARRHAAGHPRSRPTASSSTSPTCTPTACT